MIKQNMVGSTSGSRTSRTRGQTFGEIFQWRFLGISPNFLSFPWNFNTENVAFLHRGAKIQNQHRYGAKAVWKTLNWENLHYNHYSFFLRWRGGQTPSPISMGPWPDWPHWFRHWCWEEYHALMTMMMTIMNTYQCTIGSVLFLLPRSICSDARPSKNTWGEEQKSAAP